MNLRPLVRPLVAVALATISPAPESANAGAATFKGTDFAVEHGKDSHWMRAVSDGAFVIYVKGQPIFEAIDGPRQVRVRVEPSLMLTETPASVVNLKTARAYTPPNEARQVTCLPTANARIVQGEFAETVFVEVSIAGRPRDASTDEACAPAPDGAYLVASIKNLRSKPALANGKPVDGVADLKLNQLLLL